MDATTALTFYAFLLQMITRLPNETLDTIFDFFVRRLGKNIIHVHPDMQTATIAIAGSSIVTRQPDGVTILIHNGQRRAQATNFGVVHILGMLLNLHLHNLLAQPAIALPPNRRTSVARILFDLTVLAVKRASVIRLVPSVHVLSAMRARDNFAKLVSVEIMIPLNTAALGTVAMAESRLRWIQNNIHLLQAHTSALLQLKLYVRFKDLAVDSMTRCTGPSSINEQLIVTMACLARLSGKHKLVAEYMIVSSTTMAKECEDLEDIVAASGRSYIETFVDLRRRTVEVTVQG